MPLNSSNHLGALCYQCLERLICFCMFQASHFFQPHLFLQVINFPKRNVQPLSILSPLFHFFLNFLLSFFCDFYSQLFLLDLLFFHYYSMALLTLFFSLHDGAAVL